MEFTSLQNHILFNKKVTDEMPSQHSGSVTFFDLFGVKRIKYRSFSTANFSMISNPRKFFACLRSQYTHLLDQFHPY